MLKKALLGFLGASRVTWIPLASLHRLDGNKTLRAERHRVKNSRIKHLRNAPSYNTELGSCLRDGKAFRSQYVLVSDTDRHDRSDRVI
jgi:hypothetical protein